MEGKRFIEVCKRLFVYHEGGYLVNKTTRCKRNAKKGSRVGKGLPCKGYRQVIVEGKPYREHVIVWVICKGELPDVIDHIDYDIHNNKIDNLRSVEHKTNIRHGGGRQAGITVDKRNGKYQAAIYVDCVRRHLGSFFTYEDALACRLSAEEELWGNA